MKVLYIAGLRFLRVEGNLGRGIRLWDDVFLTNEGSRVDALLTPAFEALAGGIEVSNLRERLSVVYQVSDVEPPIEPGPTAIAHLDRLIAFTSLFMTCLWIVKDCSANIDVGFVEYPYRAPKTFVSSNTRASYWSNALGKHEETAFTADEVRQARNLFGIFERENASPHVDVNELNNPAETSRIARTFYFLQAARGESDLGAKLASYVTCLESLLSTDAAELAHRLAERTAIYLGGTADERIATYRMIKTVYGVRSKVVHGDYLSAKALRELESLSVATDSVLRTLLNKILTSERDSQIFHGPSQGLEDFMLRLVVGGEDA